MQKLVYTDKAACLMAPDASSDQRSWNDMRAMRAFQVDARLLGSLRRVLQGVTCTPENWGCSAEKEARSMSDTRPRTDRAPASGMSDPVPSAPQKHAHNHPQ